MEDQDNTPLEVLQPSAIMAMEKAQIDIQISTALAHPRRLELFKQRALAMATLDPDTADSCIYTRPVGKERDEKTGRMVQKYAEGPSIRLAEIVAVCYGNLRAASKVVEQTERYVKCTGMAHDLESNTAMSADSIESTVTKEGHPYSERQRALTAKVCGAKALRDSIFKVVPRALCKPIMEAAKRVAAGKDRPMAERIKKVRSWIGTLKIDEKRVLAAINLEEWDKATEEHLLTLTGLKTAMQDGDETIDSAFPPIGGAQGAGSEAHKPAATGHQQATAGATTTPPASTTAATSPANVVKLPQETAKSPQEAPKAPEAPKTPAEPETPQQPQTAAEAPPQDASPKEDEAALAEAGLAPAKTAPQEPTAPPDIFVPYEFVKNTAESDALQSVRMLMAQTGMSETQMLTWCISKKLAKVGQKLSELAESKLISFASQWQSVVGKVRAELTKK